MKVKEESEKVGLKLNIQKTKIVAAAAAAAKSLQSCLTLCDPIDSSPPGSPIPGILQARTLEWVAISFSRAWKWKVKVKLVSRVRLLATPWTTGYQAPPSMGFSRQKYWSGLSLPSPKIMASSPITSWQIDGETVETVADFILGSSKITADGDCSHEIKRHILLGRKVMNNLDNILKSRDITLPTNICLVKAMVFPVVMYGCEGWTIKKAKCRRIDAFELWCWRRLLRVLGLQGDPTSPS